MAVILLAAAAQPSQVQTTLSWKGGFMGPRKTLAATQIQPPSASAASPLLVCVLKERNPAAAFCHSCSKTKETFSKSPAIMERVDTFDLAERGLKYPALV
jgi:hypothetical protein